MLKLRSFIDRFRAFFLGDIGRQYPPIQTPKYGRAMYLVNAGALVMVGMKVAKLVLPRKLFERMNVMQKDHLKDLIPEENLLSRYGGKFDFIGNLKEINYA